jgi:hypothetical protein
MRLEPGVTIRHLERLQPFELSNKSLAFGTAELWIVLTKLM